jgi:DNA-directed RNA polymerase specialized sigma24 family protein
MDTRRGWLGGYELLSLGDFELTPELDRDLSGLALAARVDPHARYELFVMLAVKIARFSSRFRRRAGVSWDYDDVLQETWVAFDDVLRAWRPLADHDPPAGFGYYFLGVFAFRLRDRVEDLTGRRWSRRSAVSLLEAADTASDDDVELSAITNALLEQMCGRLNAVDATILRHRAAGLEFAPSALRASGIVISRRTVYRRWGHILRIAREVCGEQRVAG